MTDKVEIQELISRYSDGITRRDWEAVALVFAPDATWQILGNPGFLFTGAKVGPGIRSLVEPSNYLLQMNTPALIDVKGEGATARSTIMESAEYEAGRFQEYKSRFNSFGFYDDILKKVDGKWRFASRRFTMLNMNITRVDG